MNLENFEAFKMSKTQMNAITGGAIYCTSFDGQHSATFVNTSLEEAQQGAEAAWGNATCEEEI